MTIYQRALQIWMLLVCAARERKILTYGEIAKILGMKGAGQMGNFLGPIMFYCEENNLPPLSILVVNQKTGLPGDGLVTIGDIDRDRERVFRYNWFGFPPPETQDFEDANTID